jgi:hypothetical protein
MLVAVSVPSKTIIMDWMLMKLASLRLIAIAPTMRLIVKARPKIVAKSGPTRGDGSVGDGRLSACSAAGALSVIVEVFRFMNLNLAAVRFYNFCHCNAELVFNDDNLTTGNQAVVHVNIDSFTNLTIQFNNRATTKFQKLTNLHG